MQRRIGSSRGTLFKGLDVRIDGISTSVQVAATQAAEPNKVVSQATLSRDVETARKTALSALTNERFRVALEKLSDPRASETVALMRNDGPSTDLGSAQARYADNSN